MFLYVVAQSIGYGFLALVPYMVLYKFSQISSQIQEQIPLFDIIHFMTRKWKPSQITLYRHKRTKDLFLLLLWAMFLFHTIIFQAYSQAIYYTKLLILLQLIRIPFYTCTLIPLCQPAKIIRVPRDILFGGNCDYIFSGHTTTFILLCYVIQNKFGYDVFPYWWIIWSSMYGIWIIILREHYTIDILVSFLICVPSLILWEKNF